MWLIGVPLSLMVKESPESDGLLPDGRDSLEFSGCYSRMEQENRTEFVEGFTVSQAMRTGVFWTIALAVTISATAVHSVAVHVMPYLISSDIVREKASLIATFVIFSSIPGRFGLGWLSNYVDDRYLLTVGIALQALGLLFLIESRNLWAAILFIASFGPGSGGVITLRLTVQAKYFGRRAFGSIQGSLMAITIIGTILGPLLTGMCYDRLGDYRLAWVIMAGMNLAVVPFALKMSPPPEVSNI
jgi:cyanate permease